MVFQLIWICVLKTGKQKVNTEKKIPNSRLEHFLVLFDLYIPNTSLHRSCLPDVISVNTILPLFFCSCWDTNEHGGPWWVIRIPILISIIVSKLWSMNYISVQHCAVHIAIILYCWLQTGQNSVLMKRNCTVGDKLNRCQGH